MTENQKLGDLSPQIVIRDPQGVVGAAYAALQKLSQNGKAVLEEKTPGTPLAVFFEIMAIRGLPSRSSYQQARFYDVAFAIMGVRTFGELEAKVKQDPSFFLKHAAAGRVADRFTANHWHWLLGNLNNNGIPPSALGIQATIEKLFTCRREDLKSIFEQSLKAVTDAKMPAASAAAQVTRSKNAKQWKGRE